MRASLPFSLPLATLLTGIVLTGIVRAAEVPAPAMTGPPQFATVTEFDAQGSLVYRYAVWKTVIENRVSAVRGEQTPVQVPRQIVEERMRSIAAGAIRVTDLAGRPLPADETAKRLKMNSPIVISADGQPISDFYRQFLQPDVTVIIDQSPQPGALSPAAPLPAAAAPAAPSPAALAPAIAPPKKP